MDQIWTAQRDNSANNSVALAQWALKGPLGHTEGLMEFRAQGHMTFMDAYKGRHQCDVKATSEQSSEQNMQQKSLRPTYLLDALLFA